MKSKSLMLGETCLDKYVSEPKELEEERKRELDELIGQLEKNCLNVEQLPLLLLKVQRENYPVLNPEFLSMGIFTERKDREVEIKVPRFAVYKRSEKGFDSLSLRFAINYNDGSYYGGIRINEDSGLPSLFETHLIRASDFYEHSKIQNPLRNFPIGDKTGYNFKLFERAESEEDKKFFKKFPQGWSFSFNTEFHGIFPDTAKEKLTEADKIFGKDVYLIAETKPEDWQSSSEAHVNPDPLLTGVAGNKLYLVDHFNTTPMENYARSEFTE